MSEKRLFVGKETSGFPKPSSLEHVNRLRASLGIARLPPNHLFADLFTSFADLFADAFVTAVQSLLNCYVLPQIVSE